MSKEAKIPYEVVNVVDAFSNDPKRLGKKDLIITWRSANLGGGQLIIPVEEATEAKIKDLIASELTKRKPYLNIKGEV